MPSLCEFKYLRIKHTVCSEPIRRQSKPIRQSKSKSESESEPI